MTTRRIRHRPVFDFWLCLLAAAWHFVAFRGIWWDARVGTRYSGSGESGFCHLLVQRIGDSANTCGSAKLVTLVAPGSDRLFCRPSLQRRVQKTRPQACDQLLSAYLPIWVKRSQTTPDQRRGDCIDESSVDSRCIPSELATTCNKLLGTSTRLRPACDLLQHDQDGTKGGTVTEARVL